jgi:hypothetical protein
MIARYPGICPLCSTYIAARRSRIVRLPEAMIPRTQFGGVLSADDGGEYNSDGKPISREPRDWAHARCWDAYVKAGKPPAPIDHGREIYGMVTVTGITGRKRDSGLAIH